MTHAVHQAFPGNTHWIKKEWYKKSYIYTNKDMGLFFLVIIPILLLLLLLLLLSVWWQFNENILVTPRHHPGACEWERDSHKQTCKSEKNGRVKTSVWSGFKRNATHGGEETGRKQEEKKISPKNHWLFRLDSFPCDWKQKNFCFTSLFVCFLQGRGGLNSTVRLWNTWLWKKKPFQISLWELISTYYLNVCD